MTLWCQMPRHLFLGRLKRLPATCGIWSLPSTSRATPTAPSSQPVSFTEAQPPLVMRLARRFALPWLRKAGGGAIVNMASVSSFIAQAAFVPYNTSKGAIMQLTRCLAMDLGPENIRVNAVCPGTIDTPATSLHAAKLGITKATFVLWLLSPSSNVCMTLRVWGEKKRLN